MKKKRQKKPVKRIDVGCPNSHLREHLCLTPKQVKAILLALRGTMGVRSKEAERLYLRKVMTDIERQVS